MGVVLILSPSPVQQFFGNNGRPLVGGLLFTYIAGTNTKISTYTDESGGSTNTNPIVLDYRGECRLWLDPTLTYKFVLSPRDDTDPPTNPIWTVDDISGLGGLTQQIIGRLLWPRTSAEIAANVTPANYAYQAGDIRRYGALTSNTDNSAAIQAAIDQAGQVGGAENFIPAGTWAMTSAVTGVRGLKMTGEGRYRSIIQLTGGINFLTFTGTVGDPDGGSMIFREFAIKGSPSSGNHIELTSAGQNEFTNMEFWMSGASFVRLDAECHNTHFWGCFFRSWTSGAVYCTGLNSIISVQACQFSILGADAVTQDATSSCIVVGSGEHLTFSDNNLNGDDTLYHFIRIVDGAGRIYIGENYGERIVGPNIITDTGAVINGAVITNNQVSCVDSVAYDFSAGNPAHTGLFIRNIRRPETTAVFIVSFGSGVVDFDYSGTPLDGLAQHVVGYSGYRTVKKYVDGRVDLYGNPSTAVTTLANYTFAFDALFSAGIIGGILTPAQITSDQNDYEPTGFLTKNVIRISTDASRNITGMGRDGRAQLKWLVNVGSFNAVLNHQNAGSAANKRFRLPGSANYTIAPNEGVLCFYDTVQDCWRVLDK